MEKLTPRQQQILNFINKEVSSKNYPPSVREICEYVGLSSSSTVHSHLKALERKGYIKRVPTKPRAIELIGTHAVNMPHRESRLVRLVGQVTAGLPVLAEENIEDYFALPGEMVKGDTVFMLRVKGDSMKDAGILNQDYVIVRQQSTAENGEIVVALLNDEATVKKFYRETDHIILKPANSDYQEIIGKDNITILGKVIGLLRLCD